MFLNLQLLRQPIVFSDCLRVGTMKGIKHFTSYIRGREELVLTVQNNSGEAASAARPAVFVSTLSPRALILKPFTTKVSNEERNKLFSFTTIAGSLPPASPCARDLKEV